MMIDRWQRWKAGKTARPDIAIPGEEWRENEAEGSV